MIARSTTEFTLRVYTDKGTDFQAATWGCGDQFVRLLAAPRGGCLWCSEIMVWDRATGRSKSISSTMGLYGEADAATPEIIAYMASMWNKHLGQAAA